MEICGGVILLAVLAYGCLMLREATRKKEKAVRYKPPAHQEPAEDDGIYLDSGY